MTRILYPFLILSGFGLILSFIAHILSLYGRAIPGGELVWSLHIGVFVVWIPTVLVANRITKGAKRKDFWKIALSGCPTWMRQALYVLFAYAILNFIWFMNNTNNHTGVDAPPSVIRGFSGHWMVFYAAAFATLYSVIHSPNLLKKRKCPNGHAVSVTDSFCPNCGQPINDFE